MKKIIISFFILFLISCSFSNNKNKENIDETNVNIDEISVNNSGQEEILLKDLVNLYEQDKDLTNQIISGEKISTYGKEQYFLDALDICKKISEINIDNKSEQENFMKEVGIFDLYNDVLNGKIENLDSCLTRTGNCDYQRSDLVIVSYFAKILNKDETINLLLDFSDFYKNIELGNSLVLKVLANKISGEEVSFEICKNEFLKGIE